MNNGRMDSGCVIVDMAFDLFWDYDWGFFDLFALYFRLLLNYIQVSAYNFLNK